MSRWSLLPFGLIAAGCMVHGRLPAQEGGLIALENARAAYTRDSGALKSEHETKLKALRDRHRQVAEKGKAAATKKGDLKLALAWERLEAELQPAPAKEQGKKTSEAPPKEVEKARAELVRETAELSVETVRKLRALRDQHRKGAEQGKEAATKSGDLKLALAWEELLRELQPDLVNVARQSKVAVNAQVPENPKDHLIDGDHTVTEGAQKYWYAGRTASKPDWASFALASPRVIHKVRLLAPVGTAWLRAGHEPLDYELTFKLAGKLKERVSVRGGAHPQKKLLEDGRAQWIDIELKSPVAADEVEFRAFKTSGANKAPVVFELEILAEK